MSKDGQMIGLMRNVRQQWKKETGLQKKLYRLNVNDYKDKQREVKIIFRRKKSVYEMEILESTEETKMENTLHSLQFLMSMKVDIYQE
jgi:hypothetical protein